MDSKIIAKNAKTDSFLLSALSEDERNRALKAIAEALTENKDACAYCAYRSACGFDETQPGYAYREFPAMKMKDVIERCRKS